MQIYENITGEDIDILISRNCRAEDWSRVRVATGFDPEAVSNCFFRGDVNLGAGVYINNIGSCIRNCTIGDGAYIENVAAIEVAGETAFGNGVSAAVVNEGGGREVPLLDGLTAQAAYITAMYRHRDDTTARLLEMSARHAAKVTSPMGSIGEGARITNCGIIRNVKTGPGVVVEGATILSNGSINCTADNPSFVGADVRMYDFVMEGSSSVDGSTTLRRCFIGEGVRICGLTGNDSAFFANCHLENGEVCSIFAGPFTASHHKSSLLIAGMFSFFNAGSGSNQSNHLFKTGAVHQGVCRRGCKFGSNAYVMFPARTGVYTVVIGRHKSHHDTEDFPYSYLTEKDGMSYLAPGINLTNYGTVRDMEKWSRRDNRGTLRADIINLEEHNPFIAERVLRAIDISEKLLAKDGGDELVWNGIRIRTTMLRRGLSWYKLARDKFIGRMLADGAGNAAPDEAEYTGPWIDAAGMYMTKAAMDRLLGEVDSGRITTYADLRGRLADIHSRYTASAYMWALRGLEKELGHAASPEDIAAAIERGEAAAAKLHALTEQDRQKDEGKAMSVSYGIDSEDEEERLEDYRRVRGL